MHRLPALLALSVLVACGPGVPAAGTPPAGAAAARTWGGRAPVVAYATYEWNADDAVSRWKSGTLWAWLPEHHVNDVLAGFDDAQIAKYSSGPGENEFNQFIAQAAAHGVRVELLLGTPSWILPSGVASLRSLLEQLSGLNFAGVNLDLEPNEVTGMPMKVVVLDLISATHRYVKSSPWPVTLDVNYIYADSSRTGGVCLLCGLQKAGLRHVDLMTYVSDPATVYARDLPILERYPRLAFTVGQSVEPPSVLPPYDSYWDDGFAEFYADMTSLDANFLPQKNYDGLVIESMQYLETMKGSPGAARRYRD